MGPHPSLPASFPGVSQIMPPRQPDSDSSFSCKCPGPGASPSHSPHLHISLWTHCSPSLCHDSDSSQVATPESPPAQPQAFLWPSNTPVCLWNPGRASSILIRPGLALNTKVPQNLRAPSPQARPPGALTFASIQLQKPMCAPQGAWPSPTSTVHAVSQPSAPSPPHPHPGPRTSETPP